jgi:hypothetical protein
MTEIPLPFSGLLGKNMAKVLFLVLYLACPGEGIALCGAFFGLHFWHTATLCFISWI